METSVSPTVHFWLHVLVDGSIGLSYVSISATLAVMVYHARSSIPYHHMFLAFGAFILSCGLGHFSHIWTLLYPESHLEGYIGVVTAFASVLTALCLPPLVPKVLAMVRRAELSEQRQQAVRQRDEFLAILSHELKTPLTTLLGYAELLQRRIARRPDIDPSVVTPATMIVTQTARLQRTILEMLQLSRLQLGSFALQRKPCNVVDLVRSLVQQHQLLAEGSHTLRFRHPASDVMIFGDEQALEQVLHNLLTNAVKYSPDGGVVEITITHTHDYATIAVADEGIGVPESDRVHLFERFYRGSNVTATQACGFGIGLYIVRQIVERHDGSVSYAPQGEHGSRFIVTLPCLEAKRVSGQEPLTLPTSMPLQG